MAHSILVETLDFLMKLFFSEILITITVSIIITLMIPTNSHAYSTNSIGMCLLHHSCIKMQLSRLFNVFLVNFQDI